jgi:hypothetical protein
LSDPAPIHAFRPVPRTGVIYVTTEAQRKGYRHGDPDWSNLGQGQPETGPLPGAPDRRSRLEIDPDDDEYAPVPGVFELREAVASLYNQRYRRGLPSQYTAENVAISGGGRASLTRAAAALGQINLGHFLPDYTAYEELLDVFRMFSPIPILLEGDEGYEFRAAELRREILGRGLSAILISNPCNPTGKLISGDALADWVQAARDLDCALLIDEFYSHYVWRKSASEPGPSVSAARYVTDVDRDPIVLFDGLTKNWRYPGWRVTWTVGPRAVIEAVTSAGSFLDGGGSKPLQRAAIELLTPEIASAEAEAIQRAFRVKRESALARARAMGMSIDREPDGTFYAWVSVAELPASISDGMAFFRAALDAKVIVVPGEFFDVNPGKRRAGRPSRFRRHVRLSFGPSAELVERGLSRLEAVVQSAKQ